MIRAIAEQVVKEAERRRLAAQRLLDCITARYDITRFCLDRAVHMEIQQWVSEQLGEPLNPDFQRDICHVLEQAGCRRVRNLGKHHWRGIKCREPT